MTAKSSLLILSRLDERNFLTLAIQGFLLDCRVRGLSQKTIAFYDEGLRGFAQFCESRAIQRVTQVTPDELRLYLLHLQERGRNAGGVHAAYRAVRAFLNWFARECEPEGWENPASKVRLKRVMPDPIEGVSLEAVERMLATCGSDFLGVRDRAILLCLLDSGARANEFLSLRLGEIDPVTGRFYIRKGKGGKGRFAFLGKEACRALRGYLRLRRDDCDYVWVNVNGGALGIQGLRAMLRRRAKQAGLEETPSPHDFRRAFALECLRNGMDVYSLQRMMGHSDLSVLRRYLAQTEGDLQEAHRRASPADRLKGR